MQRVIVVCIAIMTCLAPVSANDKEQKPMPSAPLLVVPPTGSKEVKLVDWRFTQGTRHLDLTGKTPKGKTTPGAEYLEFREEKSTTYKNGIFTLVPLTAIRKIEYDREKKAVTVIAFKDDGAEATLAGSTKSINNRITIEAEAVLDGLGAATVKFNGGIDKGLQSVTFPAPKAPDKAAGPLATIVADDKEKTKHAVSDVQPVYLVDGQYRIMPFLMFKKTVKVDMEKLKGLKFVPAEDKKKGSSDYELTLNDGAMHTLSILTTVELEKKKSMTLVGLIGRVPVGYKLFMLDSIYEYRAPTEDEGKTK